MEALVGSTLSAPPLESRQGWDEAQESICKNTPALSNTLPHVTAESSRRYDRCSILFCVK